MSASSGFRATDRGAVLDLWLVRHAESVGNLDGSAADTVLSPAGRVQARALATRLASESFTEVLCSPLLRARETAALSVPSLPLVQIDALRELESSRRPTFVDPTDPDAVATLLATPLETSESGPAFMARVRTWLRALPADGTVLAFTHFAVIREVLGELLGFRHAPQRIDFTAVFRVSIGAARAEPLVWNDTGHLPKT